MRDVLIGQTDYTVLVKIVGTDGNEVTGLTNASIDIAYCRVETDNDVTTSDVTPASLSALTDAHSDWGFKEVSSTDHPGLYRLDIADAVFASGAWEAVVTITDASGEDFYSVDIGFRLVNIDPQAAVLPANVTQFGGSAGTFASGRPEVNTSHIAGSAVSTSTAQIGVNVVNFGGSAGTFSSGRPEVNTTHIAGTAWASTTLFTLASHDPGTTIGTSTLTQTQVTGGAYALNSASFAFNAALDFTTTQKAATLARVTLVDTLTTYTGNTPQTGDAYAYLGTNLGALGTNATEAGGTGDHLTALATATQATNIEADTQDIQSRLPAALTADGNIKADSLRISGSATAADNVEQVFDTDFADVYNATDNHWHVDVQQVKGSATAAQNMTTVFATDFATNYDSTNDKWNTRADLQTIKGQTVTCAAGVTVYAHVGTSAASTAQTGDAYAYLGTNLGLLGANATEAGGTGDQYTAIPWNASWDTEVQSEVADALTAYDPPTRTEATADKDEILAQLPAAPSKNVEFTYVIKMVDATDNVTPETGLTITMTRSIDGAAFASATGVVSEISSGHYKVVASAADMNGDVVAHRFAASGAADLTVVMKTVS